MANIKISQLPSLSTLADSSVLAAVDSSTNYKVSGSVLKTYVQQSGGMFLASEGGTGTTGYSFVGDGGYDTGMFSSADGYIQFYSNNTKVIEVNPTGQIVLIGSAANASNWENAKTIVTQASTGRSHTYNFGLVGEAVASASDSTKWGIGVYGRGNTNGAQRSGGVMGDGGVTNTADSGSAVGVRGYADDTHAGGLNVGLYGSASNSAIGNYALYMNAGNIYSGAAQTWALNGALSFSGAYDVSISNNLVLSNNNKSLIFKTTTGAKEVWLSVLISVIKITSTNLMQRRLK